MLRHATSILLALVLLACGGDKGGDTETGTSSTTDGSDSMTATDPTSGSTTTGDIATTDGSDSMTATGPTSGSTTTGDIATTDGSSTTDMATPTFERFRLNSAAGPCPPQSDCDGFIELLADRTLRVEKFGDVGDPVTEVQISEKDFLAALNVFTNPMVDAALDAPDPLCQPPTDIFESMELVLDGVLHDATTTTCTQPPLIAARETASALQMLYVP